MKLIIVTGLSGSGKSIALSTLEDLDYYCVDNLPICLLQPFANQLSHPHERAYQHAAVGIDARNDPTALADFPELIGMLKDSGLDCQIVFLQAEPETLLKRFSETRRKHPLSGGALPLAEAIRKERALLEPIAANADIHIDTTHTNVHQLRDLLRRLHGSSHHVGEEYLSADSDEVDEKNAEISDLRAKLRQAIETENFELAAELRDRLRTLE